MVNVTVPFDQTIALLDCERLCRFLGAEPARGVGSRGNGFETGTFCFHDPDVAAELAMRVAAVGFNVAVRDQQKAPRR